MEQTEVQEILQRVRRVQIVASRVVDDLFAGEYHSVFRGRGMEFDEVREYSPGDDVRTIDWNVTARAGVPFVKRFREERELTVLFLVDVSASCWFGSTERNKRDVLVETAAMLMFSALKNNDKVGLMMFADEVRRYLPPRKGRGNVLRFLRELVAVEPSGGTSLAAALETLQRVHKRRAVVFLLSDFLQDDWSNPEDGEFTALERLLATCGRRHDLVALRVRDRRELELDDVGLVEFRDLETGELRELDSGSRRVREWYAARARVREEAFQRRFRRLGIDELVLDTVEPPSETLWRFFRMRERRLARGA